MTLKLSALVYNLSASSRVIYSWLICVSTVAISLACTCEMKIILFGLVCAQLSQLCGATLLI